MIDYNALGERIRNIRLSAGISQETLGDMLGLSYSHISRIENGQKRITLDSLVDLAMIFKIRIDQLLFGEQEQEIEDVFREVLSGLSDAECMVILDTSKQ